MKALRYFFLVTDVSFVLYWLLTLLHALPAEYLFKDYQQPVLMAWNWSFLPLDLLVSATGFYALYLHGRGRPTWRGYALLSLVLTSCSGLQAVAFWALRQDFDPLWWVPNLYLLLYPLVFVPGLLRAAYAPAQSAAPAVAA